MEISLIAKIETPTTVPAEDGQYKNVIGTGYPVRDGLVISARHVLYHDKMDNTQQRKIIWKKTDAKTPFHKSEITGIVFECIKTDIALVACDTPPLNSHIPTLARSFDVNGELWTSMGYPRGGKNKADGERIKTPAGGKFFQADSDSPIQELTSAGDATETALWRGMSGAPVFNSKTSKLSGVLIRTPDTYKDENGIEKETFKERLYAVSIPYLLKDGKCAEFRKAISTNDSAKKLLPKEKKGEDFLTYLREKIAYELRKRDADTNLLCEQLITELGLNEETTSAIDKNKEIARSLIHKEPEDAIDLLSAATADCVVEDGDRFAEAKSIDVIKEAAQQILGWLVVRSIDEQALETILPRCLKHNSFFFTLASVQTLTGVEIVMARRFNRKSDLEHESGAEQKSRFLIKMPESCYRWDGEESVRKIFIEIWNQVFKKQRVDSDFQPDQNNWKTLNENLKKKREHQRKPEHYYIPFKPTDHEKNPDFVKQIYQELLIKLEQMTVIQFGEVGKSSDLFIIDEAAMQASINSFYQEINGELG